LDISDTVVVVTGGGAGLGMALCRDFASRNAAGVVVVDLDEEAAAKAAAEVGGVAVVADVGRERELGRVVELAREAYGRVDIFVSNAGTVANGDPFTDDDVWRNLWQVNVMSGVYAARLVLPEMLERGSGHLAFTASSTGLTTSTGDMVYAATKHAQVACAEWLAMAYGSRGIGVTCFCPRWMWTEMTRKAVADPAEVPPALALAQVGGVTAAEAAASFVEAIVSNEFLATTYHDVLDDFRFKAENFDGWIARLQEWHDVVQPEVGRAKGEAS
jgi:NAD(P)-dependent dehydrogenase (short-subunit alcohol dehydrogenase family)